MTTESPVISVVLSLNKAYVKRQQPCPATQPFHRDNYRPQTKLRKGNVFTSVCLEFCPRETPAQGRQPPKKSPPRQTPPGRHSS